MKNRLANFNIKDLFSFFHDRPDSPPASAKPQNHQPFPVYEVEGKTKGGLTWRMTSFDDDGPSYSYYRPDGQQDIRGRFSKAEDYEHLPVFEKEGLTKTGLRWELTGVHDNKPNYAYYRPDGQRDFAGRFNTPGDYEHLPVYEKEGLTKTGLRWELTGVHDGEPNYAYYRPDGQRSFAGRFNTPGDYEHLPVLKRNGETIGWNQWFTPVSDNFYRHDSNGLVFPVLDPA